MDCDHGGDLARLLRNWRHLMQVQFVLNGCLCTVHMAMQRELMYGNAAMFYGTRVLVCTNTLCRRHMLHLPAIATSWHSDSMQAHTLVPLHTHTVFEHGPKGLVMHEQPWVRTWCG